MAPTKQKSAVDEAALRRLFAKGLSFTEIARELGSSVTAAAVAGMVRRLKLQRLKLQRLKLQRPAPDPLHRKPRPPLPRAMTRQELNEMLREAVENTQAMQEPE
jgi:hypothetical protein